MGGGPGIGVAAAEWLVDRDPMLLGADNTPVEVSPNPDPELSSPVHQIMLVVNGIHLVERMKLDELAATGVHEFAFVVQPLKIQGGTGSTVAPVAIYRTQRGYGRRPLPPPPVPSELTAVRRPPPLLPEPGPHPA